MTIALSERDALPENEPIRAGDRGGSGRDRAQAFTRRTGSP
jgi:hypothetical protein